MPISTRASASAELGALGGAAMEGPYRSLWRALIATPAGRAGVTITGIVVLVAVFAPLLALADPFALVASPLIAPSVAHPLGTDGLGRDVFSAVLHAARTSLLVAALVTVLATLVGTTVGLVAGYSGGVLDDVLTRLTELLQVLPRFFLVVVAAALFGPGVDRLILTLGLTSWPVLARVTRAEVLSLRESDFMIAAEASGASRRRVLVRHLLPNVLPSILVLLGLLFGQVLLVEASLGFLGLGDPGALSWGLLVGQAQSFLRVAWWVPVFPGLAIAVTVFGVNLLADAVARAIGSSAQ